MIVFFQFWRSFLPLSLLFCIGVSFAPIWHIIDDSVSFRKSLDPSFAWYYTVVVSARPSVSINILFTTKFSLERSGVRLVSHAHRYTCVQYSLLHSVRRLLRPILHVLCSTVRFFQEIWLWKKKKAMIHNYQELYCRAQLLLGRSAVDVVLPSVCFHNGKQVFSIDFSVVFALSLYNIS